MALQGVPVLQYDGLGATLPGDVDARLASHWIAPTALARQLVAIRGHGHRVVKLYDAWTRDETEPLGARTSVVLTFDDGRAADYEMAFPLLLAAGVRAEFFINTAKVGRRGYLTWPRIEEMHRAGMSFQSHSHDHVALPALSTRLLRSEIQTSKRLIEDFLGRGVDFLAAPHGLVDRRVVDAAQEAGYRAVCASRGWPARPGNAVVNRVTVLRDTTEAQFSAILARRPQAYLSAVARALVARVQQRAALKLRPPDLDDALSPRGV
jgi:peptidoglycan/xylan/chitin deacetylase (PgdA/CDA1 family)